MFYLLAVLSMGARVHVVNLDYWPAESPAVWSGSVWESILEGQKTGQIVFPSAAPGNLSGFFISKNCGFFALLMLVFQKTIKL